MHDIKSFKKKWLGQLNKINTKYSDSAFPCCKKAGSKLDGWCPPYPSQLWTGHCPVDGGQPVSLWNTEEKIERRLGLMELNPEQKSKLSSVRDEPKKTSWYNALWTDWLTDYIQPKLGRVSSRICASWMNHQKSQFTIISKFWNQLVFKAEQICQVMVD